MTQQDRQFKKVKLYRALKVAFYCLGLPLFVVAVFLASVRFIGSDPFTGNANGASQLGFFHDINILFTSPALYGVWIAFGIWVVIAILHIILSKTVKSRRVRTLAVTAFALVIMLGGMFTMDAVLSAKIDAIASSAPSSVTVADYKTQLSYYRTVSSGRHSNNMTEKLIKQVELLEEAYHVSQQGRINTQIKTGVAGSIANKPVTYYNVIADDGETGVDIGFKANDKGEYVLNVSGAGNTISGGDGVKTKEIEGKQVIRLAPNSKGQLVINGKVYSHYFAQARNSVTGGTVYTWYTKDMESTSWVEGDDNAQIKNLANGIYGKALYSQNGLISDGWVFGLDNVIEILEDYYEAQAAIDDGALSVLEAYYRTKYNIKDKDQPVNAYALMYAEAAERRDQYYKGELADANGETASAWLQALYKQEADMTGRFSLTRGEIDELLAKVGALLGDNALFSYLFNTQATGSDLIDGALDGVLSGSIIGTTLKGLFEQLATGLPLSKFLDAGTIKTVGDILQLLTGKTYDHVDDLYVVLVYKDTEDCFGIKHDNLYLAIVRGEGSWKFADDTSVPVTRGEDGKWYYEDETEFVTTADGDILVDKDGNEVKFVTVAGADPATDIMLDIDFDDRILGVDEETGEVTYAFDFDTLSKFLNTGINNLIDEYVGGLDGGVVGTILNLVKSLNFLKTIDMNGKSYTGLVISGINIPLIDNETNKFAIDINGILEDLVKTLYNYQSAVIKPVWEFYEDPTLFEGNAALDAQRAYAKYERAMYEATVHGKLIGSVLIGDTIGTGAYPSSLGLTDLASVQQLKTDLSYQPMMFPLFAVRDMLAFFTGLVIMFYFLSFVAAQREEDYATGKLTVRNKKDKAKHEEQVIAEFDALDVANAQNEEDLSDIDLTDEDDLTLDEPKKKRGKKEKAVEDDFDNLSDEELALLAEEPLEEEKTSKKHFGKKNKTVEEDLSLEDVTTDELTEEEPKKKKHFGKKKQEEENEDTLGELTLDDADTVEEKPKKKRFGKKEKEVEDELDGMSEEELALLAGEEVAEEKPKKKRFGKKDKEVDEFDDLDNMSEEELAALAGDSLEEDKPKKKLFGKSKKSKQDGDDESLNGDGEEVL